MVDSVRHYHKSEMYSMSAKSISNNTGFFFLISAIFSYRTDFFVLSFVRVQDEFNLYYIMRSNNRNEGRIQLQKTDILESS